MPSFARALFTITWLALAPAAVAQPVIPGPGPAPGPAPAPGPGPAPAPGPALLNKITPQQLAQLLVSRVKINDQPIQVSGIRTFDNGDAAVLLSLWPSPIASGIVLEQCEKDGSGCHWLGYQADLGKQSSITPAWVNAFNGHFLAAKAFINSGGELIFSLQITLYPGISQDEIVWYTGFFKRVVDDSFNYKGS